ncbi:uncharacterized protein TrAtP1_002031 [Trichoderma atroviride]|uniref:uncharacterized protein n=1 Tax=Hypocrea atroviridis TaxID=63577 RepID=UPI00331E0713|nr:hypothetical protein TrAtP1_002031 [Trichoderma atroviride]
MRLYQRPLTAFVAATAKQQQYDSFEKRAPDLLKTSTRNALHDKTRVKEIEGRSEQGHPKG